MNYHILTLFPEMVTQGLSESILGRAAKGTAVRECSQHPGLYGGST